MDVQARSFLGFTIVGSGISQEAVDRAREQVETELKKHSVSAAELGRLPQKMMDVGMGVDLAQFNDADWRRYGIDPAHIKANRKVLAVMRASRKMNGSTPASTICFKAEA